MVEEVEVLRCLRSIPLLLLLLLNGSLKREKKAPNQFFKSSKILKKKLMIILIKTKKISANLGQIIVKPCLTANSSKKQAEIKGYLKYSEKEAQFTGYLGISTISK